MKKLKLKKGDIVVLAVVLCIAASVALCIKLYSSEGSTAIVEVDANVIAELPLYENTVFHVEIDGEVTNTVVIEDGSVYVKNANCPDKICQNHRPVSKTGESIVCLPNKVAVTIVDNSDDEIDGVVR